MSEHHNFDGNVESFDQTTVQLLQNLHFNRNILKFVLGYISSLYARIDAMKTDVYDTPSNTKCDVSTGVPFKTLFTQHQY